MTATPMQMKIFVSHNHRDVAYCQALVEALRGAGADVWYDQHNMGAGRLVPVIERELRARPVFLVVLSPAALGSQWVEDETLWAFNLYRKDPTRILLPVLCDTVKEEDIWLFLSDFRRIETPGNQPYPREEAIRQTLRVLALTPAGQVSVPVTTQLDESLEDLLTQGKAFSAQEKHAAALPFFERATQLDPTSFDAWFNLGDTLNKLKRYAAALPAHERAIALAPDVAAAWQGKAIALRGLEQTAEAEEAERRAKALDAPLVEMKHTSEDWTFAETKRFASPNVKESLKCYKRYDAFAVDDGLMLYLPPGFRLLNAESVASMCQADGDIPGVLAHPTKDQLRPWCNVQSERIRSYLLRRADSGATDPTDYFETKVGLTRIDFPLSRSEFQVPLTLHVEPLSYWAIREFNRRMLEVSPDDELFALRDESLSTIVPAHGRVDIPCPSGLYVELSVITSDRKLVVLEKNSNLSVLASQQRRWTCTIEEGLLWTQDIRNGHVDFVAAARRGAESELRISQAEIASIDFFGIALEHTHLNSALLGLMTLRISSDDMERRVEESDDFGLNKEFWDLETAYQALFAAPEQNGSSWHPTGRMRALFALYKEFGRSRFLNV